MIRTQLWAQLGNQCFMLAAAIAHAKKMNTTFSAPRHTINPRLWPIYFHNLPVPQRATRGYYKEPRHAYDPLPEVDDLTIEGYFQSEKYFADAKAEIAKALGFDHNPTDYIAVHVRRGDYLLYPDQFPVLHDEYYKRSIVIAMKLTGCMNVKIYSDDIDWCIDRIGSNHEDFSFTRDEPSMNWARFMYSTERDPVKDMRDMYNANAFIIANSTFSLFPALLRQDNPLVIAPAENRWYGPANAKLETYDLMPERFIKI